MSIDIDEDPQNADWLRMDAWKDWPDTKEEFLRYVADQNQTVADFKRLPWWSRAVEARPWMAKL